MNLEPVNPLEIFIMENQIITGIGCFAGPEKLSRIFLRMVQTYTLGQLEDIELFNGHDPKGSDGTNLLKALITGKPGCFRWPDCESFDELENKIITGFFLSLKDQKLELSIFTKGNSFRQERYTASLDEFTKIRRKRLN